MSKVNFLGKDFLLQVGDGAGSEAFTTIGGFKANSWQINQGEIDVTDKDGTRDRKLIAGGIRSMDASGSGCFSDDPQLQHLIYLIMNTDGGYKGNFRMIMGNGAKFTGPMFLKSVKLDGPHDKEENFSIDLSSAGAIAYLAPAPTITSVAPGTGVAAGGLALVSVVGSGFQAGATVKFGVAVATAVVVIDGSHITCTTPAHVAATVDVVVTNPDAQLATATGAFIYT